MPSIKTTFKRLAAALGAMARCGTICVPGTPAPPTLCVYERTPTPSGASMEASVSIPAPVAPVASEPEPEASRGPITETASPVDAPILTRAPLRASEDVLAPTAGPSTLPTIGQGAVRNAPLADGAMRDDADSLVSDMGYLASLSIGSDPLASTHSAANAQLGSSSTANPGTVESFVMVNIKTLKDEE